MALDLRQGQEYKNQQLAEYDKQLANFKQRKQIIEQERANKFYQELQRQLVSLADEGIGKVSWTNGVLAYHPGRTTGMTKIDLWNEFSEISSGKGVPLNKATFDALYNDFKSTQNELWKASFDYAISTGARKKDVHQLYRDNKLFQRDLLDFEATGFSRDVQGGTDRADFAEYIPSGSYMRHGDTFMGAGAIPEWVGEHPKTTLGIGAGIAGAGYLGRNKPKALAGKMGRGGFGTLGAFAAPTLVGALGAPKGVQDITQAGASTYLLSKAAGNITKNQTIKAVTAVPKKDILKAANALDVKVTKGQNLGGIQKALGKKIKSQNAAKTLKALSSLKGKAGKTIWKKLGTWGLKTGAKQAGATGTLPLVGNIAMAGLSAYELGSLFNEYFSEPDTPKVNLDLTNKELQDVKDYLDSQNLDY